MTASAQGQDRSNYQAVTNWNGLSFGFAKATEDISYTDSTFSANWHNLAAEGKYRGAYHFFHPGHDPIAQGQHFVSVLKANGIRPGDMAVVDSEIMQGVVPVEAISPRRVLPVTVESLGLTPAQVDEATLAFLEYVHANLPAGVIVLTYTDLSMANFMTRTAAKFPDLWIAWPSSTAPSAAQVHPFPGWVFWQWSWAGGVDHDAFNGDPAQLTAFIESHIPKPPSPYRYVRYDPKPIESLEGIAKRHNCTAKDIVAWTEAHSHQAAFIQYATECEHSWPGFYRKVPAGIYVIIRESA